MVTCRPLLLFCLVALLFCQALSEFCSLPAEEGKEFTFGHVQVDAHQSVTWMAYFVPGMSSTISTCTKDGCSDYSQKFQGTVGQLIDNKVSYSLKIVNVSRTTPNVETAWALAELTEGGGSANSPFQCQLQVYAPGRADCQPLQLVNNNQFVSMACDVTTYPHATCVFQEKDNNNNIRDLDQSQMSQGPETQAGSPVYYSRTCSMTVAISKPGFFLYRVVVKTLVQDKPSVVSDGEWKPVPGPPQTRGCVGDTYNANVGANKQIRVPIYSYPNPDRFALSRLTGRQNVCRDRYDVSYQPGQLSNGTVVLELHSLEHADNGSFVLAIGNGLGSGLDFPFHLYVIGETLTEERDMYRTTLLVYQVLTAVFVPTALVFLSLFLFFYWEQRRIHQMKRAGSTEVTEPRLQMDANYESIPIRASGTARSIPTDGYLTPIDLAGNTKESHNDLGLYSSPADEPEDANTRARSYDNPPGEQGQAGVYQEPDGVFSPSGRNGTTGQGVGPEARDGEPDVATVATSHPDRENRNYGNINIYDAVDLAGMNQDAERNAYTHIQLK